MAIATHSASGLQFRTDVSLHPSPTDWRDQFIYFLMVDRFDNNDPKATPYRAGKTPTGRDPEQGRQFQGGNLKGITRRLDYIKELGCTAIWLSPILKNRMDLNDSYHGYGIQDFLYVDPRFGTLEDLQELSRQAHDKGMYIIMDVVINHTGDVWCYPDCSPYYYNNGDRFPLSKWHEQDPAEGFQENDAVWPSELQDPDSFKRKGQIWNWNDRGQAIDGDFLSLKELDLPRQNVLDTLIKVYKHWIDVADVDGFRIDTVKHVENTAMAIFCNAIREYAQRVGKHRFFLFGEILAQDQVIEEYLGRNTRIEGTNERFPSLDAALDFPLYFTLEQVIKGFQNPRALRDRYDRFRTEYTDHGEAGRYFVTFVDNHDRYNRFMHNNPFPKQAVLAIGYLLTSQGVPCIYYGTEQGFDGGGDNDRYVRECMFGGEWGAFDSKGGHFFNKNHAIYKDIQSIARVRQRQSALRYGRQYFREISGNGHDFGHPLDGHCTLAYSRILDTEEVLVCMNLDNQARQDHITVDSNLSHTGWVMNDLLGSDQQHIRIEETNGRSHVQVKLEPHQIAIMKAA